MDLCSARVNRGRLPLGSCPLIFNLFSPLSLPAVSSLATPPVAVMQHDRSAPPGRVSRLAGRGELRAPPLRPAVRHCHAQVAGEGGRDGDGNGDGDGVDNGVPTVGVARRL